MGIRQKKNGPLMRSVNILNHQNIFIALLRAVDAAHR